MSRKVNQGLSHSPWLPESTLSLGSGFAMTCTMENFSNRKEEASSPAQWSLQEPMWEQDAQVQTQAVKEAWQGSESTFPVSRVGVPCLCLFHPGHKNLLGREK